MIFWMRYVPHSAVAAYEALGWRALGKCSGHHGIYAEQMRWDGEGEPPEPTLLKPAEAELINDGVKNDG